ncbi:hypothetical protein CATYP_04250 [Corynebacterium atypicum]|uniref:TIGR03085 family protein n=1 Tax=Corynebacterium atypicum TaxID=191610 RepID=A0ABN4DCJ8_9CORY|nr:TIGR03085 family metal-binding protein [Corynebacterium atypicum]AIG63995.1 hypothetical protein CATYP_04250 [Corynebacterium atypicum]
MTFAAAERRRLAALLLEKGPQAPTLCEGWQALDLAAHLYIREHRPDAAAGMFVPALSGHLDTITSRVKQRGLEKVVNAWAAGPPRWNPMRYLDRLVNTAENFVHLEDLRRGGGEVKQRDFSQSVDDELWALLGRLAPMFLGKSKKPVVLIAPGRQPIVCARGRGVATQGDDVVRVSGTPGELVLWVYGREKVEVEINGDESAIRRSSV